MLIFLNCPPNPSFADTFERCCSEYEQLFFASAYCDWPRGSLVNSPLKLLASITAVLGSPQNGRENARIGFGELAKAMQEEGKEVHVHAFQQSPNLFHPKVYVFRRSSDDSRAVLIGSSNFTRAAFRSNEELDILLEGKLEGLQIESLRGRFHDWFVNGVCLTGQCTSESQKPGRTVKLTRVKGLEKPSLRCK